MMLPASFFLLEFSTSLQRKAKDAGFTGGLVPEYSERGKESRVGGWLRIGRSGRALPRGGARGGALHWFMSSTERVVLVMVFVWLRDVQTRACHHSVAVSLTRDIRTKGG